VTWLAVGLTAAYTVSSAFGPSLQLPNGRIIANPIGVAGIDLDRGPLGTVLNGLLLLVLAAAIVSLVVRFHRSRGVERQQLKWFTYPGALVLLAPLSNSLIGNVSYALILALPVAVGVAVLRYRLYDIDRLINRTLVYGLLTTLLGAVYAGVVLVLGQLFGSGVTSNPPSWAVAGATLAVAALFRPARHRIQQLVDRRFNRRKYDAATTIEAFSGRLRDEIDLDTLSAELLAVVNHTMEPTTASLWLRSPSGRADVARTPRLGPANGSTKRPATPNRPYLRRRFAPWHPGRRRRPHAGVGEGRVRQWLGRDAPRQRHQHDP
jgi:hypothetical protein